MKKRKLNIELLRKIQKHISEEPRRFFMEAYSVKFIDKKAWINERRYFKDLSKEPPPCGTAACIAGTTNLLTNGRRLDDDGRAAREIGVEPIEYGWNVKAHPLFVLKGWPMKFKKPYRKAKTPKQRAKIACARIDWLIEKGE